LYFSKIIHPHLGQNISGYHLINSMKTPYLF
jgi:hypothetical protein